MAGALHHGKRLVPKYSYRPKLEVLETRRLLNSNLCPFPWRGGEGSLPNGTVLAADIVGESAPSESSVSASASSAMAVPALSSLPGAPATLYLDFNGHFEAEWGSYSNVNTPAYDVDGDAASFSATELANIEKIWRWVAEDFSPFNLNVTTVEPPSFDNGVALRVAIGGDSSWTGGRRGGLAHVNSFTNPLANTVYVCAKELDNGNPRYVANASSEESGHAFGLAQQAQWSGDTFITMYQAGPGDDTAPLMGYSYAATRSLWWYGTTISASSYQHDLDVIARSANGFGYRADDHGSTATAATLLDFSARSFTATGVIEQLTDLDYFGFSTAGGIFTFTVAVAAPYNNLDARLELRDANNNLLVSASPGSSFDASITVTLSAGNYFLVVASAGVSSKATASNYGFNVGQYSLRGSLAWINTRKNTSVATARNLNLNSTGGTAFITDLHNLANVDYYRLKVPAGSNGTITITMDAAGPLMPRLIVYKSSLKQIGRVGGPAGSVVTLTLNVKTGNTYYIVANGPNLSGAGGTGTYRFFVQLGGFATPLDTFSTVSSSSALAFAGAPASSPHSQAFQGDKKVRLHCIHDYPAIIWPTMVQESPNWVAVRQRPPPLPLFRGGHPLAPYITDNALYVREANSVRDAAWFNLLGIRAYGKESSCRPSFARVTGGFSVRFYAS